MKVDKIILSKHPSFSNYYAYHWTNQNYNTHKHTDSFEIIYTRFSFIKNEINGKQTILKPNTIYICAPNTEHYIEYLTLPTEKPNNHFNMGVLIKQFHSICNSISSTLLDYIYQQDIIEVPLADEENNYINYIIERLTENGNQEQNAKLVRQYLTTVLSICDINLKLIAQSQIEEYARAIKEKIDNLEYISLDVTEIYAKYPASFSLLVKTFKKLTGKTIVNYQIERKMKHAAQMLLSTKFSVSFISQELGYSSESFFIKTFKSIFNITPYRYRVQNKTNPNAIK